MVAQPELKPFLAPIGESSDFKAHEICRAPGRPGAQILQQRAASQTFAHISDRDRGGKKIEVDRVAINSVIPDRVPSHYQEVEVRVAQAASDLSQSLV